MQMFANMHGFLRWVFLLCVGVALAGCASREAPHAFQLSIISVHQWGGTPANETLARRHTISRITLHHQGVAFGRDQDPQQYLRDLQSWSRTTKGWIDVPYHYMIDLDGRVYEGRDIRFAGDTKIGRASCRERVLVAV